MTGQKPDKASASATLANWVAYLRLERHLAAGTVANYHRDVQEWLQFFAAHSGGEQRPASAADIRAFLAARLQRGVSHAANARALSALRGWSLFNQQLGNTGLPALEHVSLPRLPKSLPRALARDDTMRLMAAAGQHSVPWVGLRNQALLLLLYGAGLRLGEALALSAHNITPSSTSLRVTGKGNKQREVPLLPLVRQTVLLYSAQCPWHTAATAPLFVGERGKRLSHGVVERWLQNLRRQLSLPETLTPHALRHSCATHLLSASGDLRGVQELLGHAALSSTQIYTDVDEAQLLALHQAAHPRHLLLPKK